MLWMWREYRKPRALKVRKPINNANNRFALLIGFRPWGFDKEV